MKKIFLSAISLITIGLLAGCGSQEAAVSQNPAAQSAPAQTAAREPAAASSLGTDNTLSAQSTSQSSLSQRDPARNAQAQPSGISEEQASAIALADAGISEENVSYLRTHLDRDDGFLFYEVDFASQGIEYDYEIQVSDGAILKAEQDREEDCGYRNPADTASSGSLSAAAISLDEAKELVLEKVPGAAGSHLQIELAYDDGLLQYEGELYYNGTEYEFEINAENGKFLKWQEEFHD